MKVVERKISELIPAEYNPRYISDEQLVHLKASIQRFEAVEPVLVNMHPDRKNIIISGHQRVKAAKSLGMAEFPCVELSLDRDKERELNIRMNKNTGGWDWDELANHFDTEELTEWGFTEDELFSNSTFEAEENLGEDPYTKKIESPVYEPKGEKPEITELYNNEKFKILVQKIEKSKAPNDIKEFLKICASRHIVFDYANIADFYAHSDKEIQGLMEESALVIIDFKSAIKNGYVRLSDEISKLYLEDYGDEE